jgi:hypothetical protein
MQTRCDLSTRAAQSTTRRTDSDAGNISAHLQVYGTIQKLLHMGIFVEVLNVPVK